MAPREQLEWEARAAGPAGAAAVAAAVLYFGSNALLAFAGGASEPGDAPRLLAVDAEPAAHIASAIMRTIALVSFAGALWYLYRATRHRKPDTPVGALLLGAGGSIVLAVLGIVAQIYELGKADEFAGAPPRSEARADAVLGGASVLSTIGLGGILAFAGGAVLLSVNAMRAGLLSRFMGFLGVASALFFVLGLPVLFAWVGALGVLFLDRWPGGRGPAWSSVQAVPWPSAAATREARGAGGPEPAAEVTEPVPDGDDPGAPRAAPAKRKRKRRS